MDFPQPLALLRQPSQLEHDRPVEVIVVVDLHQTGRLGVPSLRAQAVLADEVQALRDRRLPDDRASVALEDGMDAESVEGDGAGQHGDVGPSPVLVVLDDRLCYALQRCVDEWMVRRVDEQPA